MSEVLTQAEAMLQEATAIRDSLAREVATAERTLVKRRQRLAQAEARVREIAADVAVLKRTGAQLKVVGS